MGLCNYCSAIPFVDLPAENEDAIPHQPDLDCLKLSAKNCRLCNVLSEVVDELLKEIAEQGKNVPAHFFYWRADQKGVMLHVDQGARREYFMLKSENAENSERAFLFPNGPRDKEKNGPLRPWLYGNWWTVPGGKPNPKLLGMGVRIARGPSPFDAEGQDTGTVYLRGSALRLQTWFDEALTQARRWLEQCDENHTCVDSGDDPEMPTRVVAIDQQLGLMVRLVDERNQRGRYIALSHCWGTSHRITLTKATMDSLKKGIPITDLPKTFRDAFQVAKNLHVQYLWIDSLCIVQDDPADWATEASKMSQVYTNAYLTVAASSSLDDDSGCFPPRDVRVNKQNVSIEYQTLGCFFPEAPPMIDYYPSQVPGIILSDLQYVQITKEGEGGYDIGVTREWLPPSTKTDPLPFIIGAFGEMFDPLANEPLSKRGWCLQERLLSRRTLHYASSQMFWECAHGIQSEDGCFFPRIQPDGTASVEDVGKLTPNAFRTLMPYVFKSVEAPLLLFGLDGLWWTDLVAEYSQRNLTVEQDKLSALAGLARNYAAQTGDTYIAGLWHGSLGLDLCWRVYTRVELVETSCGEHSRGLKYGKTLSTLKVPAAYRAPSWSWASIDAGVTFNHFNWADKLFYTVHGEVKGEGIDLFGRVKEGYLQLQGPLLGILCKSADEQSIRQPFHGVPLVVFYPHYYYEKADEYDVLDTMPFASCRPGFTRHMETNSRGNRVPRSTLQVCRSVGDTAPDHDEGCQSDETIEAITSYMRQIDISVQSGPSGAEARFLDAKAAHSKLVVTGEGHFDVDPTFPCVALFLDNRYCLLLEQTNNEYRDYRRVGLGYFQPESEKIQPVSRDSPMRVVCII